MRGSVFPFINVYNRKKIRFERRVRLEERKELLSMWGDPFFDAEDVFDLRSLFECEDDFCSPIIPEELWD